MNKFQLVKAGMPCYISTPFKLESIMQLLERNEKYIFWIQPPGTTMQKQIACVQINDVFYQLNLRLEKAIFRHIRLCRNFINEEMLADGTPKLRIPIRLLREKMRTSLRSKVCLYDFITKSTIEISKNMHYTQKYKIKYTIH